MTPLTLPRRPRLAVAGWLGRLTVFRLALLGLTLCGSAAAVEAAAPQLTSRLDTNRVTLGDPLHLYLRVERDVGDRTLFPDLADQLAPYDVRRASAPRTQQLPSGRQLDERVYELRLYSLDADSTAAIDVAVVAASGDTLRLRTALPEVEVVGVRADAEGDSLRAIKPPLRIPGGIPLWFVGLLAALLVTGVAWLAWRYLRRAPAVPAQPATVPRGPVDYVREFARIAEMGLLQRGATKLYYTRLADVMRRFLQERLGVEALERTTTEIATDLQSTARRGAAEHLDEQLLERIVAYLAAADLVKFARAEPDESTALAAPDQGAEIVREVEALLREHARQAAVAQAAVAQNTGAQAASAPAAATEVSGD